MGGDGGGEWVLLVGKAGRFKLELNEVNVEFFITSFVISGTCERERSGVVMSKLVVWFGGLKCYDRTISW